MKIEEDEGDDEEDLGCRRIWHCLELKETGDWEGVLVIVVEDLT